MEEAHERMGTIRILGGGISGLTAAITLKRKGFDVEVHERSGRCGKQTNDFQFLENWTFHEDSLDFLRRIEIEADFYVKPWFSQEFFGPSLKRYVGRASKPLMYLVKRGSAKDSIDRSLERQAVREKVIIVYHSRLKASEANIIATGKKKPTFIVTGILFELDHPDRSVVLLDKDLSTKAYGYCIVNDGIGEIACANPPGVHDIKHRLDLTSKRFEKILNTEVKNIEEKFFASIHFNDLERGKAGRQYVVGEAAGFQDHLAGFGMVYAFKSGYFAAKSIAEKGDYDRLWKKDFLRQLKISSSNRVFYEKLSNNHFERIIEILGSKNWMLRKLRGGNDLRRIMQKLYNSSFSPFLRFLILRFSRIR